MMKWCGGSKEREGCSARAKRRNVCTRSYVEVYRGKIGAKTHFCPRSALRIPSQTPSISSTENSGHVAVSHQFSRMMSCTKAMQRIPRGEGSKATEMFTNVTD